MKKFISNKITTIVLLALSVVFIGVYAYMLFRPISYGMSYSVETIYEGTTFKGSIKFNTDSTSSIRNSSVSGEIKSYYYYKNGYIFSLMAKTEEEYKTEVENINSDFKGAVNTPFYASKINAFKMVSVGPDGYTLVYKCTPAIVFAVVGGITIVVLLGFSITGFIFCLKTKKENKN